MRTTLLLILFTSSISAAFPVAEDSAEPTEERFKRLEQQVAHLEAKLDQLLTLLESRSANTPGLSDRGQGSIEASSLEPHVFDPTREEPSPENSSFETEQEPVAEVLESGVTGEDVTYMPVSGYMDFHVNNDGLNPTTLDFHRFVLLFGHGFGEHIRFWSELELEHAFVEGGEKSGELELEQAYLDFLIHPSLNLRTGMLLTPVGIINERHEPPSFFGVERPFVDTFIVPSTWFGSGMGLVGDLGRGFAYRTYVMSSLDATGFSAEEGFRGGLQKGFFENARNLAYVGRLDYRGLAGLNVGGSFWTGETGFSFRDIDGRLQMFEIDGRYRWRRFEARGQFVLSDLDDSDQINEAVRRQLGVNPNIARQMRGFYLEGAASLFPARLSHDLAAFYRYENFDTQYRMPEGFLPLEQFDRSAHIIGLSYFPFPDIALKFDYNIMRNQSLVVRPPNRWNFGVGWWF